MADTEEFAKGYALMNDTQYEAGTFLLKRLAIKPGMQVLDVGCGPGNLTALIADCVGQNGNVVGIDPSEERIDLAKKYERANLSFSEGRAEDLSQLSPSSFDVVFVNSTFHWIQDQSAALDQFARILKPGGLLGISGGSGDFTAAHEKIKASVLSREPYRNYPETAPPRFLKQGKLEQLLDNARFSNRQITVNTIVKWAPNAASMVDWLDTSSSGKTYGGIPLDMRQTARREMEKEWEALATESGIHMDMELLVTMAVRD